MEHGIGEMLQGSHKPESLLIVSWPDSSFFSILGGEPAFTIVPSLLVSGILTVMVSLVLIGWSVTFAHRRCGGHALLLICVALFLVGGGFGPPVLGSLVALAVSRMRSPHAWASRAPRVRRVLAAAWPWVLGCGLAAWLLLMPGIPLLAHSFSVDSTALVVGTILSAFVFLILAIFTGFARDAHGGRSPTATCPSSVRAASRWECRSVKLESLSVPRRRQEEWCSKGWFRLVRRGPGPRVP